MKKFLATTMLIIASTPAFAIDATPFFSVYAGAGGWATEVSGDLGGTSTDVEDLGIDDETNNYFYVAFEHWVPVIPNVRLEQSSISTSGAGSISTRFDFADAEFLSSNEVETEIDITMLDAVLYYEIAMFDIGLTFRQFDVEVEATGTVDSGEAGLQVITESKDVDGVLPMLYVQTKIDLPFTGFYVTGSGNYISYDDKSVTDFRAALGYGIELSIVAEIGLELGFRSFAIDLGDEDDFEGDISFSGAYLGANVKF